LFSRSEEACEIASVFVVFLFCEEERDDDVRVGCSSTTQLPNFAEEFWTIPDAAGTSGFHYRNHFFAGIIFWRL
jgi:hypothetical protein